MALVLFGLALLARWPLLAGGETLLQRDEAVVGLMAQDIAGGRRFPIYFYGQSYMGALEAYVVAALSPFFDGPIVALRFGPACFLAALVSMQYLMLTRWFGRRGGLMGAAVLLAGAPMFVQWSVSARGGYIEVMLWGSALLWAYSEWFVRPVVRPVGDRPRRRHRLVFGLLLGSGLWINTSIVALVLPIVLHALLDGPLARVRAAPGLGRWFRLVARWAGRGALPLLAVLGVFALNAVWAIWVDGVTLRRMLLLNLVSAPVAAVLLVVAGLAVAYAVLRDRQRRAAILALPGRNGAMILGILIGMLPAIVYVLRAVVLRQPVESSLLMGVRPIWTTGSTMVYLIHGLPLLFGADPQPFIQFISVGRDLATKPLGSGAALAASIADWVVLVATFTTVAALVASQRRALSRLLALRPTLHPPAVLLLLGVAVMLGLFVLAGCSFQFQTIRYLLPIWVFVPGLFAAVFANRVIPRWVRLAPVLVCAAWVVGQVAMIGQLGNPHPLRALASAIDARGVDPAIAEPMNAHLLSYLTEQRCRIAEFEPFWPRLAHFQPLVEGDGPTDYIVQTRPVDRAHDWIRGRWPGRPPPETRRELWPRLRGELNRHPEMLISREPLVDGFELIRLRRRLPELTRP